MKKYIFLFVLALSVYLHGQTPVWSKNINGSVYHMSLNTNSNKILLHYATENGSKMSLINADNAESLWEIKGNQRGCAKLINNSFYCTQGDTLSEYNEFGQKIFALNIPGENSIKYLLAASHPDYYVVVDAGWGTGKRVLSRFNYSNALIDKWYTLDKVTLDIALLSNKICLASFQYGGGTISNVHGFIAMYETQGKIVWTDSIPDAPQTCVCADDFNNIYCASWLLKGDGNDIISIRKYSENGILLWEKLWNGNCERTRAIYPREIRSVPGGKGCIISGEVTREDAIGVDVNEKRGFIVYIDNNGEIKWVIKKQEDSVNTYSASFQKIAWDKNNYLITSYSKTDWNYKTKSVLYKYSIDGVTAIEKEDQVLPQNFSLSQNYPNPFNPSTKINFSVTKSGFVTLKVYDLLGREVSTLVNEEKTAGNYSVDFSAKNLASGTYIYRLITDKYTASKKMVLVK